MRLKLQRAAIAVMAAGLAAGPAAAQNEGRLLASNCFQCHGTNGKPPADGFERLAGKSAGELYSELKEMQSATSETEKAIMAVHARGYTDAELHLIANFLATRK